LPRQTQRFLVEAPGAARKFAAELMSKYSLAS
jgi:hypothetical protein